MTLGTGVLLILVYMIFKWVFRYLNLFLFITLVGKIKEQKEKEIKEKFASLKEKGKGVKENGENV